MATPASPKQGTPSQPVTPDGGLRNRSRQSPASGDVSPTSTQATAVIVDRIPQSLLQRGTMLTTTSTLTLAPAPKKIVIRADPAIVTAFDPADKELYDLWAPKR